MIRHITGDRPTTCPWMAFADPVVVDVLDAYRACANGMGVTPALLLPSDPPHHVWMGLQHYCHVMAKAKEDVQRIEKQRAEAPRG